MSCTVAKDNETANWSSSFPSDISSLSGSTMFMKRLMAVAISHITYLRAIFPESSFGTRKLADIDLKILSDCTPCPAARQVINWLKSCFEAFDHRYLRQLMLGVHTKPGDHDNVVEAYTFEFSYSSGDTSVTCNGEEIVKSAQLTKRSATVLLRTLVTITQTLEPLPDNAYLTMKLLYYDDVTPRDYEPLGFVPSETDDFFFNGKPVNIKAGNVSTAFHSVKVRVRADQQQLEMLDEEPIPSGSIGIQSSGDDINLAVINEGYAMDGTDNWMTTSPPGDTGADDRSSGTATEINVCCPCGNQEEEGLMISCMECKSWQHAVCFGILEESEVSENHVCYQCFKTNSCRIQPNDKGVYNPSETDLQSLCLWRRALLSICDFKVVQPDVLARTLQIQISLAVSIIQNMENHGYLTSGTGRNREKKYVNRDLIMWDGIPKYFKRTSRERTSRHKDISIEELNTEARNLDISSIPGPSSTYQQYEQKQDGENYQLKVKEGPHRDLETNAPVSQNLHGIKRAKELGLDFDRSFSQELECDNKTRRKRRKASTCECGILLPCTMDK